VSLNNKGTNAADEGRFEDAEEYLREALREADTKLPPSDPRLANMLMNLATVYDNMGRYAEAEPLHLRGLRLREETLGPDDRSIARSLNNLASHYLLRDEPEKAETLLVRAIAIHTAAQRREDSILMHPKLGIFRSYMELQEPKRHFDLDILYPVDNLMQLYLDAGRYDEAENVATSAEDLAREILGVYNIVSYDVNTRLRRFFYEHDEFGLAEPHALRSVVSAQEVFGKKSELYALALTVYGMVDRGRGEFDKAEEHFLDALRAFDRSGLKNGISAAYTLAQFGDLRTKQVRYAEADSLLSISITMMEDAAGDHSGKVFGALIWRAEARAGMQQFDAAYSDLMNAKAIGEVAAGFASNALLPVFDQLVTVCHALGRDAEADEAAARAKAIREAPEDEQKNAPDKSEPPPMLDG
jgi:tetratricopeptide (TPR) repeat protein